MVSFIDDFLLKIMHIHRKYWTFKLGFTERIFLCADLAQCLKSIFFFLSLNLLANDNGPIPNTWTWKKPPTKEAQFQVCPHSSDIGYSNIQYDTPTLCEPDSLGVKTKLSFLNAKKRWYLLSPQFLYSIGEEIETY